MLALLLAGCPAPAQPPRPPIADTPTPAIDFDGEAALATLQTWLSRTRTLGVPARAASIDALVDTLRRRGADTVERIDHEAADPGTGARVPLTEIVAEFRRDAPRRFVLATHFDTRPWADEEPDPQLHERAIPGANDGTSGLAVVLELIAPLRSTLPDDVGFVVVLFDGEELGRPGHGGYCMGSRHLAARMAEGELPRLRQAELGIVLDMVGDRELRIVPEPNSQRFHPALVEAIWRSAAALHEPAFAIEPRAVGIVDDHKFLSEAGIPSVLLIDRDYAWWHRLGDDASQVSAASLGTVGRVVLHALVRWYADDDGGDT
ncbi:MAG: M28 family peptidase [Nannocystaceae bacterium]|nr:M28 family peptidase [Nannocystaceae bacterium]